MTDKKRAGRNRTLTLSPEEQQHYARRLTTLTGGITAEQLYNRTIHQDLFEALNYLPPAFIDLLIVDPPYNLTKSFNGRTFSQMDTEQYSEWLDSWLSRIMPALKPTASVYLCGDWRSSHSIYEVASRYLHIRNRITWEREKGRGALTNWKNASEDIWFCTVSNDYIFNVDQVKMKRRVLAPYRNEDGKPKDWEADQGGNFRLTYPSNLWTDLTVPFWSMPENTDHPTQKPEKLAAKLILASSNEGDVVFDPFLGSGTTSVVAKKLGRRYVGIEIDEVYCCLAEKRLEWAETDSTIQGYHDGVFWERNSKPEQQRTVVRRKARLSSDKPENDPSTGSSGAGGPDDPKQPGPVIQSELPL